MDENIDFSKNIEINEALKEFEIKNAEQTAQISSAVKLKTSENSKMARWIMKISGGIIKEEQQAEYVLLGFAVLAIIISLFLVFSGNNQQNKINIDSKTGQEIIPGQIPGEI